MSNFRRVTDQLSVSPQITEADVEAAAAAGFKAVICNRPDEEDPTAPSSELIRARAEALGLTFMSLPFSGAPTNDIAQKQGVLIASADGPVLAYCRSGTRSITAWALSQAGQGRAHDILAAAAGAGYDLSALGDVL